MPTHDYILSNQSGASFRTDLNNALAAIVSNNSNSSSPATTYAYQWWADTTANILKIRNSSNNAWINLFTLAGGIDVDAASNFNEDVTFTGASANIVFDKSDNALEFADNAKAKFGAGDDLAVYHDGSNSFIQDAGTGTLKILANQTQIINAANSENIANFIEDSKCELFFDNSPKVETNSTGINMVDKVITMQGQSNRNIRFRDGENDMIFEFDSGDFYRQNIGSSQHEFYTANNLRLTIQDNGNIGAPSGTNIFNASDSRVKKNVENIDKGLSTINSLRPISFNWIDGFCDTEKNTLYGFIAQEVQTVDNNLIQDFSQEITVQDTKIENVLTVNEKFIIPILVKAIQELSAKVAALEAA